MERCNDCPAWYEAVCEGTGCLYEEKPLDEQERSSGDHARYSPRRKKTQGRQSETQKWLATMASTDDIEEGARAMYGKHWDGPPEKSPGEKMKDVWRGYARLAIEAVDAKRGARPSPLGVAGFDDATDGQSARDKNV